jgi:hypothetical protein
MQAFLQKIDEKDTRAGKMYDLVFSDGNKVGAGKFPPKNLEVGAYYNYEFTQNGNFKNLSAGSLSKATAPAGVTAPPAKTTSTFGSAGGFDSRQEVISKQAALNSSMAFVSLAQSSGALALPAAKAKQLDALESIVMDYAAKFYKLATGNDYPALDATLTDLAKVEEATNWSE